MKTLFAVRHAKSSWGHPNLGDHDRPLNERGQRNGPEMAARLKRRGVVLDRLIVSSARRAQETASFFADALGVEKSAVLTEPALYGAGVDDWIQLAQQLNEDCSTIMMIGHNPTLTEFAYRLGRTDLDNVPTCGVLACQYTGEFWANFGDSLSQISIQFDFPKNTIDDFV